MNVPALRNRLSLSARRRALTLGGFCVTTGVGVLCVMLTTGMRTPLAQTTTVPCQSSPEFSNFVNPPEIDDRTGGILKGTIYLVTERQRLPTSIGGAQPTCRTQSVRNFRKDPPPEPFDPEKTLNDPMPGPTLRARVGDLVQLTFVNQIYPAFEGSYDVDECTQSSTGYPGTFNDVYPNCLHASSTANIHFHGTHTNPDSTGDNVYLQIRPLPRNSQAVLDPKLAAEATATFKDFFSDCTTQLRDAPLKYWPATWNDMPPQWVAFQERELKRYQENFEKTNRDKKPQRLFDMNQAVQKAGGWPLYYIGAFPYCFALPEYPGPTSQRPAMGQLPGTHWYHAHKHGSTALNVLNGMTGAFIIEGKYDDDLSQAYGAYRLTDAQGNEQPWRTQNQKVMVLNQLGTELFAFNGQGQQNRAGVDFMVNGRVVPNVRMQPGEVQLWRIINTSGRTAAYFMPPVGLQWRQVAQDGVQYDDANYQASLNRPFYMAPANRVDLLVKAPVSKGTLEVRVQNAMAMTDVSPENAGLVLLRVDIAGPQVTLNNQPAEMRFLEKMLDPPEFLTDITEEEFKRSGSVTRTLVFDSKGPQTAKQHTINDLQFDDQSGHAHIGVDLGAVEEWKVVNTTAFQPIDHPLHIHINPFQITEMFDPNERILDWDKRTTPLDRYVFDDRPLVLGQCRVNPRDESTWKPCGPPKQGHWWDVSRIPAARRLADGTVIPGHFRMRSRFVDYGGSYVMHCHILIHEDRGMMFSVEVKRPATRAHH